MQMSQSLWIRVAALPLLLLALLLLATASAQAVAAAPEPPAPTRGVVAQVPFTDPADVSRLAARYDVWHVDYRAGEATIWLTPAQMAMLRAAGHALVVDRQATDALERATTAIAAASDGAGIPGFSCYRTVEESYASLAQLATDFPDLVRSVTLGESWQRVHSASSGYELRGIVLTNQKIAGPKPIFFLMAAIHARELTTAETALRFAEQLVRGYGVDPDATWLLDYTEIHIVPQSNPDGRKKAEAGLYWRKNTNSDACTYDPFSFGVDLNRNSTFKWGQCTGSGCSSADACSLIYRGASAGSEPEVQALEEYLRTIFPDVRGAQDTDAAPATTPGLMISLHSYSPRVLFPWGWSSSPAPNADALQTLWRKFGYYTGYPACQSGAAGCIYLTDGSTDDFAYGELGVAAYTFELGTDFFQSCSEFETSILPSTLDALTYAAKAAIEPYVIAAGPEVISATLSASVSVQAGDLVTLTVYADDTRYDSGGFGVEPVQAIQAVRYAIDPPGWITGTVSHALAATDGAFDAPTEQASATIDTTGWALGRHLVLVEAQDSDGVWGVPSALFLDIGERRYLPFIGR